MNHVINVGLIGYGYAGYTFHAPLINAIPQLKLVKVVERNSTLSRERYPWVDVVKSPLELYQDEAIDLVVVATPSDRHFQFAKEALLAGKHVVVEKPFTVTSAEAERLIKIANEQKKF